MVLLTSDAVAAPAHGMLIDERSLFAYLSKHIQGFSESSGAASVLQFAHGQSNPTYLITVRTMPLRVIAATRGFSYASHTPICKDI